MSSDSAALEVELSDDSFPPEDFGIVSGMLNVKWDRIAPYPSTKMCCWPSHPLVVVMIVKGSAPQTHFCISGYLSLTLTVITCNFFPPSWLIVKFKIFAYSYIVDFFNWGGVRGFLGDFHVVQFFLGLNAFVGFLSSLSTLTLELPEPAMSLTQWCCAP